VLTSSDMSCLSRSTSASVGPGRSEMGVAVTASAPSALMETGRGSSGREKWKAVMCSRLAAFSYVLVPDSRTCKL
jgi:hypothetical protein